MYRVQVPKKNEYLISAPSAVWVPRLTYWSAPHPYTCSRLDSAAARMELWATANAAGGSVRGWKALFPSSLVQLDYHVMELNGNCVTEWAKRR